jgi:hypothetical protein
MMPGFVDVTSWSNEQIRRLGHADDDEPTYRNPYAYRKPTTVVKETFSYKTAKRKRGTFSSKKIKDIRDGEWVNTIHRETLKDEPSDIFRKFGKMPDKLYEITTISGRKIKAY